MLGGLLVVAVAGVVGLLVATPNGLRFAFAAALIVPLGVLALRAPRSALYTLVVWLVALGLIRRLTSGVSPKQAWGDPLLLVGPVAWVMLAMVAMQRGGFERRSSLANAVLLLWGLLAASAFNPIQGGLTVGLGGALLVVAPMSAFLVGRKLVDEHSASRLLWLVASLGLGVAIYGLVQTFLGFPAWDEAWIQAEGYSALNVGGVTRAFASFSAASEYAGFLGLAVVVWVAQARGVARWPAVLGALVLLMAALWFESSRGFLVLTVAAVGVVLAARAGLSLGRAALIALLVVAALPAVIGWLAPERFSDDSAGRLSQHQVEGLTDPFGQGSTLPGHIALVREGIESAFRNPIGTGVGSITVSGGKYAGVVGGAEGDPGRAPFAAGLPGLLAYVAVVVIGLASSYRLAALRRDAVSLAALGIVMVTFLQWLNGGHYAVAFWAWLALGWVEQALKETSVAGAEEATAAHRGTADVSIVTLGTSK